MFCIFCGICVILCVFFIVSVVLSFMCFYCAVLSAVSLWRINLSNVLVVFTLQGFEFVCCNSCLKVLFTAKNFSFFGRFNPHNLEEHHSDHKRHILAWNDALVQI